MSRPARGAAVLVALLATLVAVAHARAATADDAVRPPCPAAPDTAACAPRWRVQATGVATFSPAADLEDDRGDVAVRRGGFDVLTTYEVSPRWTVGFDLGAERSTYDFSDPARLVPGAGRLFEEGTTVYVAPGLKFTPNDTWAFAGAVTVSTGFAPGADTSDGTTASIVATVRRRVSPGLAVLVGGLYSTSLDDDATLVPIVTLMGAGPSEGPVRFEFRGAGLRATYALSPRVALAASARYVRREFRLAATDRLPEGVFRDVRVPVSLEIDLRPRPNVTFSAAIGVNAYADLRFDDRDGHEVVDARADVGLWFGISATVRF